MRLKVKYLIFFELLFSIICRFFISELNVPDAIKYVPDLINIVLLCVLVNDFNKFKWDYRLRFFRMSIAIFAIVMLFSAIFALTDILFFMWAFRVTFRFYIFLYACCFYLEIKDIENAFKMLEILYYINFAVTLFQFFVMGLKLDNLGGIFGTSYGVNGGTNIFIVTVLVYEFVAYFEKKVSLAKVFISLVIALSIAGMAEIKFLFVEVVVIVGLALLVNKPSKKTIAFAIFSVVGIIMGLMVLKTIFPGSYELLFSAEDRNVYLAADWGDGQFRVGRTTAIPLINEHFFGNDIWKILFGLGFGMCELSSFFMSDFATMYLDTDYRSFTYSMQYVETGVVGLCLYLAPFVLLLLYSFTEARKKSIWNNYSKVLLPLVFFNIWYNDTCKSDYAYMLFFAISVVIVSRKNSKKGDNE